MSNSEDIVTRCPQCNTAFRVTLNQLAVADGQVRCGSCLAVFKAADHDAKKETGLKTTPESKKTTAEIEPSTSSTTSAATESNASSTVKNTARKSSSNQEASDRLVKDNGSLTATAKKADTHTAKPKNKTAKKIKPVAKTQLQTEKTVVADLDDVLIADGNEQNELDLDGDIFDLDSENNTSKTSLFDRKLNEVKEHRRESADESWAVRMLAELEDEENEEKTHFITEPKPSENNSFVKNNEKLNGDSEAKIEPLFNSDDGADSNLDDDFANDTGDAHSYDYSEIDLSTSIYSDDELETSDDSALYFDQDTIIDDAEESQDSHKKSSPLDSALDDIKDSEALEQQASISDDEIENAITSRTHYQDDPKSYLANIEPAPVEMMDFSSPNAQRWLWRAGVIFVGLLLLVQIAIVRFDTLSKHPSYRPFFGSVCKIAGCTLPMLIDTQQIRTTNLIVRSHPRQQKALIIDAILINNAKFKQAFPALQLEFSDINDQLVASRQLQPDEYLRGELAGAKQMANNQPIQLSIEIVDPGDTAVNYQLTVVQARPQR